MPFTFFRQVAVEVRSRGIVQSIKKFILMNEFRYGALVGKDQFGNKYFENRDYPNGRHRWVEPEKFDDFDPSIVPAEWHRWLHHVCDETPTQNPPDVPSFRVEHTPNLTGTPNAYMGPTYLLTKHKRRQSEIPRHTADGGLVFAPKIRPWDPNSAQRELTSDELVDKNFNEFAKRNLVPKNPEH